MIANGDTVILNRSKGIQGSLSHEKITLTKETTIILDCPLNGTAHFANWVYTPKKGASQMIYGTSIATGPVTFNAISFAISSYDTGDQVGVYCYTVTIPELDINFNINCIYE